MEADQQSQNGKPGGEEQPPAEATAVETSTPEAQPEAPREPEGNGRAEASSEAPRRKHHVAPALIALDRIDDDATYKVRPEGEVDLLATDIARVGQLFPIEVRLKPPDRFQVICGFRRVKALRLLHREKVLARLHTDLSDEDSLLMALAAAIHQAPVEPKQIEAVRERLDSEGRLTALLRDMLDKALNPDQQLEPEVAGDEQEIDADELATNTAAKLGEINQDLALLADVFASLDDEKKLELLKQLRYSSELVAYLESIEPMLEALAQDRSRLLELLTKLSFERKKVKLSSGLESDFYIDCKKTALTAEGHYLIGRLFFRAIREAAPDAVGVGGLTLGADPLASAVSLMSHLSGEPLHAFIVRKEPKGHGTGQWVEGLPSFKPGAMVAVVEDVVTTGASTIKALERVQAEGLNVKRAFALVDRLEGGREAIEAKGFELTTLFTRKDFIP